MWEPARSQQIDKLFRLDRQSDKILRNNPRPNVRVRSGTTLARPSRKACAFQGITSSFPVGRGSVLMPRS
jgi:hypothetical protein